MLTSVPHVPRLPSVNLLNTRLNDHVLGESALVQTDLSNEVGWALQKWSVRKAKQTLAAIAPSDPRHALLPFPTTSLRVLLSRAWKLE